MEGKKERANIAMSTTHIPGMKTTKEFRIFLKEIGG
jgi:hypothetical protein